MIYISLERAIEELVTLISQKSIRAAYFMTSRSCCKDFYNRFLREINYQGLRCEFRSHSSVDMLVNTRTGGSVTFLSMSDNRVRQQRYDVVHIDSLIDMKNIPNIVFTLHPNPLIPEEKQIQYFDIEQDKVWFENEYQRELYERWRDDHTKTNETTSIIEWVQKQIDSGKAKVVETTPDDWFDYMKKLGIPANQIDVGMSIKLTEDKREDEEPMNIFDIEVKTNKPIVPTITDIDIIVPDKVVKVYFADGTSMKMVCHEEDTFDLRRCLFIAIAKKLFKDRYTWAGIEHKATELSYLKSVTKVVDKALKDFNRKQEEIARLKKNAEDEKKSKAKKKAKHDAYLKRRDERRQKEIDEKNRQQFEYDVAVQVEAARRIREEETKGHF